MTERKFPTPELNVFLVASHAMGCDVSALNTVHFTNHTGYRSWTGTKATGEDMRAAFAGLKANGLANDFAMMLTGYCPGAEAVEAAGWMALDLRHAATLRPGSFFWLLDPVMGDNGRLYVDPSVVPVYRRLLAHADLVLPNQFELETLAGLEPGSIDSYAALLDALALLHAAPHHVPHILVTSLRLRHGDGNNDGGASDSIDTRPGLAVVGSSRTSDGQPRAFVIDVPEFDCFFSGTGDLLASLMAVRLREAAADAGLLETHSWLSPDSAVDAADLPLARAARKALASMHVVLERTMRERNRVADDVQARQGDAARPEVSLSGDGDDETRLHKLMTRAAEVRVVRSVDALLDPPDLFEARPLHSRTLPQHRQDPA